MAPLRVAGINFDHMHMGDLLRMVHENPDAEIAGVFDPDPRRMESAIRNFTIPADRVFTDLDACLEAVKPDIAIVCSAPAEHARYVEAIAPTGAHVFIEKPFAASTADARRIVAAVRPSQKLMINWPLAWYRSHNTAKRLLDEGRIGELIEVHFYDGNRGPLYHLADKIEVSDEEVEKQKPTSWFYKKAAGGGSLIDYLGYGTTLGTWFHGGRKPVEITAVVDETPGIEVDQHSVTVARYPQGLSKFETRWGTISDPWTLQPIPRCGFMLVGTKGAIASYDYDDHVTLQLRGAEPETVTADEPRPGRRNAIEYMIDCIRDDRPIEGPVSPEIGLIGQRMLDTALASAEQKRTLALVP
jgi:predicted dehydrogenase